MEPPASRKGKNGFDNPRSTRIKMRQACLKRLAVEYNQACAECCSAGAICGREPAIQPGTGKGGVVRAEILELPAKSCDEKCFSSIKISRGEFHIIDFVVFQHLQILGAVINASKRPRKKRRFRLFSLP